MIHPSKDHLQYIYLSHPITHPRTFRRMYNHCNQQHDEYFSLRFFLN